MFPVGLSTNGNKLNDPDFFHKCNNNNIKFIEISVSTDELRNLNFDDIKKKADNSNVKLWSLHLPFMPFAEIDISSSNESVRNNTLELLCNFIEKGASIGIKHFIVHPSGEPIYESQRSERMNLAKKSLSVLAEKASKYDGIICVEDLPRTCIGRDSDDMIELLSADDRLKVCFDTNHLLNENIFDFVKNVGSKIVTTHISDYDIIDEKHWLPGEGVINWKELLKSLVDIGYNGPWLYEVGFSSPKTMPRGRKLTVFDFANNADEIFNGKEISIIR